MRINSFICLEWHFRKYDVRGDVHGNNEILCLQKMEKGDTLEWVLKVTNMYARSYGLLSESVCANV